MQGGRKGREKGCDIQYKKTEGKESRTGLPLSMHSAIVGKPVSGERKKSSENPSPKVSLDELEARGGGRLCSHCIGGSWDRGERQE